ncbi:MAG: hypothetical protein LBQ81_03055 [Zoogloeaceae bacterium]|jgi:hypothetical protein|nr:hypothetical protein [Zoogloeaceae bacterium]
MLGKDFWRNEFIGIPGERECLERPKREAADRAARAVVPDWDNWLKRDYVKIRDAACLTLGIEPSGDVYGGDVSKRCDLIASWFPPAERGSKPVWVMLVDVVLKAAEKSLSIPPEMAGLVVQADGGKNEEKITPISRAKAQEDRILQVLREKGCEPLCLPDYLSGKAGIKNAVWLAVQGETRVFSSRKVFNRVWERLLKVGGVRYAP